MELSETPTHKNISDMAFRSNRDYAAACCATRCEHQPSQQDVQQHVCTGASYINRIKNSQENGTGKKKII